jgi:hypothetical protein
MVVLYLKGSHITVTGCMGSPAAALGDVQSLDLIKIMD